MLLTVVFVDAGAGCLSMFFFSSSCVQVVEAYKAVDVKERPISGPGGWWKALIQPLGLYRVSSISVFMFYTYRYFFVVRRFLFLPLFCLVSVMFFFFLFLTYFSVFLFSNMVAGGEAKRLVANVKRTQKKCGVSCVFICLLCLCACVYVCAWECCAYEQLADAPTIAHTGTDHAHVTLRFAV